MRIPALLLALALLSGCEVPSEYPCREPPPFYGDDSGRQILI